MSRCPHSVLASLLLAGGTALYAAPIPYGDPGHPAPLTSLTATSTGSITGFFVDSSAVDNDSIALLDVTSGVMSSFFFANHSTAVGTTANFGNVTAGDQLVFVLQNASEGDLLRSDTNNPDGIPHAYVTSFAGGLLNNRLFPAGLYVGSEDRTVAQGSDLDYNDDNFIFSNVSTVAAPTVTPEPSTLALMGTGVLGAFGMLRRKLACG